MSTADEVREFVLVALIKPARRKGEKTITFAAIDIHHGMELKGRYALVCSSIDADKFIKYASVKLIKREGPFQGATARWTFDLNW